MKRQIMCVLMMLVLVLASTDFTVFANEMQGGSEGLSEETDRVTGYSVLSETVGGQCSVGAQSSFGNMLVNELSEEISSQQKNNGYNMFSIEMEDNIAKVSFESLGQAALVVGIYDEAGTEMLALGSAEETSF